MLERVNARFVAEAVAADVGEEVVVQVGEELVGVFSLWVGELLVDVLCEAEKSAMNASDRGDGSAQAERTTCTPASPRRVPRYRAIVLTFRRRVSSSLCEASQVSAKTRAERSPANSPRPTSGTSPVG